MCYFCSNTHRFEDVNGNRSQKNGEQKNRIETKRVLDDVVSAYRTKGHIFCIARARNGIICSKLYSMLHIFDRYKSTYFFVAKARQKKLAELLDFSFSFRVLQKSGGSMLSASCDGLIDSFVANGN